MPRPRLILPFAVVALVAIAAPAYLQARPVASSVTVTEGLPKETSIKVTPTKITASPAAFAVTNKGKLPHSFKVCTKPVLSTKASTCTGVATKTLAPGKSQLLIVKLAASGKYEYLYGPASKTAAVVKGLLTVALPATPSAAPTPVATTTTTTTTPKSTGAGASGGVVNGQATDPACSPGTLVPVGPGAGDQDDDNEGGFPTDGDGCL